MELLQEFEKFVSTHLIPDASRHAISVEDVDDEVGGLAAEIAGFCGMSGDVKGYSLPLDPLDAATATRWLDNYCTRYDDDGDPEAWVASDFSFFAFMFKDFKVYVLFPVNDTVPTFESWSLRNS